MGYISEKEIAKIKSQMIDAMIEDELKDEIIHEGDQEAARELCLEYGGNFGGKKNGGNSQFEHYLVDGAILQCNQAEKGEEKNRTVLRVSQNVSQVNGRKMATVLDLDFEPFAMVCPLEETGGEERICKDLICKAERWENMIRNTRYMTYCYGKGDNTVEEEGLTMLSMLLCKHGGIITPVESGQGLLVHYTYTTEEIQLDIINGLYTEEDFLYMAATVAGEAGIYEGYVAVAYEILNRCKSRGMSVKQVVTQEGEYTGFSEERAHSIPQDEVLVGAVIGALRGDVDNPIGDIEYHFGRVKDNDLWYESHNCTKVIVIGEGSWRNVFYSPYGTVHNAKKTKENGPIVLYDNDKGKWELDDEEGVIITVL